MGQHASVDLLPRAAKHALQPSAASADSCTRPLQWGTHPPGITAKAQACAPRPLLSAHGHTCTRAQMRARCRAPRAHALRLAAACPTNKAPLPPGGFWTASCARSRLGPHYAGVRRYVRAWAHVLDKGPPLSRPPTRAALAVLAVCSQVRDADPADREGERGCRGGGRKARGAQTQGRPGQRRGGRGRRGWRRRGGQDVRAQEAAHAGARARGVCVGGGKSGGRARCECVVLCCVLPLCGAVRAGRAGCRVQPRVLVD